MKHICPNILFCYQKKKKEKRIELYNRGKRREETGGKKKSQLTLGQCVSPTNSWKILSDDKWVMMPNRMGCFKWWVMNDKWWVTKIELKVMSDKKKSKQDLNDFIAGHN